MLTLNFNDISKTERYNISEKILTYIQNNLQKENCKYVIVYDGKTRYASDISKHFKKCFDGSFYAEGYLVQKNVDIRSFTEKAFDSSEYKQLRFDLVSSELKSYFLNDNVKISLCDNSDFSVDFNPLSYDDICSFECKLKVSAEHSKNIFSQFQQLISYFDEAGKLFAAYIDMDSFYGSLEYEFCYRNLADISNTYTDIRNYSWAAYLSNKVASGVFYDKLNIVANIHSMKNGLFYLCKCDIYDFSYLLKKELFEALYTVLPSGFGVVDVSTLFKSGFKPPCECIHIFERTIDCLDSETEIDDVSYCVIFNKGIEISSVINQLNCLKENDALSDFRYVETISLERH